MSRKHGKLTDQAWFEMRAVRKRRIADGVWIPLRMAIGEAEGDYGHLGYRSDRTNVGSLAIELSKRQEGEKLSWSDIGLNDHGVYAHGDSYKPAEIYERSNGIDQGTALVLDQCFDGAEPRVWHLNQDLVIALGLLLENDVWVCPREGYVDVVRMRRDPTGKIISIEIRADFLRDYLAARQMALRVTIYRHRDLIVEDASFITWPNGFLKEEAPDERFEAHAIEIHEGGSPFGAKTAVLHVGRTDVDPEVDVPLFGRGPDANLESSSWTTERQGRKLHRIWSDFWQDLWIEPAAESPRVRGDRQPSSCSYIIDASGARMSADELKDTPNSRWLWFDPAVIGALVERRGGMLQWYTRDTGGIALPPGTSLHFGVNAKGLICVYARDVGALPEWQRRIWMGHNVSPDGGVSEELLASQMRAEPANTMAPEPMLPLCLAELDRLFLGRWGSPLIRPHQAFRDIGPKVHRFRALKQDGLLSLAKDIARLTAEAFDVDALQKIAPPPKGQKPGSLKSLEAVLTTLVAPDVARNVMGPLFGVYELRGADAHLPSSELADAFALVHIDEKTPLLAQGFQMLHVTVSALVNIVKIVEAPSAVGTAPSRGPSVDRL
jgi:hypothetical protein